MISKHELRLSFIATTTQKSRIQVTKNESVIVLIHYCEQTACIVLFASVLNLTQHLNIQKHKPTHSSCKQNIAPKPSVWSYTHGEIQRKPAKECALAFPGS